jgi:STE24 endopeptidase
LSRSRPAARRALLILAAIGLAAAWILAAVRLWRTSVPGDLSLPHLDPHSQFTDAELDRASSYEAFLRVDALLASLAAVAATAVFAFRGAAFVRESAAGRIGTGMLLGMLGLAFIWLAELPFGLAALWWERRHDVSDLGYVTWLIDDFLSAGGQFLFISLALLIVMALAGAWRRAWWVAAVPALLSVALLSAFVQPYLIPDLHSLRDPALATQAQRLATEEGVSGTPVRVQDTHDLGGSPNAEAVGLDGSRRVIVWDTLLRRFPPSQVRVVLAHEFGHIADDHVLKELAWMGLLAIPIALAVALATRRRGGMAEPTAVPIALFVVVALLFVAAPLQNAYSRRLEAEADWSALQTTRDPGAAKALFRHFTRIARVEPTAPAWASLMLEGHPTIMQRIEMAEAWRRLHPATP